MDKKLKRQAIIAMIDYYNGELLMNTKDIQRLYHNDKENDCVELTGGIIITICCVPIKLLDNAINEWSYKHPQEFERIILYIKNGYLKISASFL